MGDFNFVEMIRLHWFGLSLNLDIDVVSIDVFIALVFHTGSGLRLLNFSDSEISAPRVY